ncbi:hypothetical protein AOL_s00097g174 [Orbilia oligospora ATCC 24927]|uniref:F-box domain-containing protein n=2 Tax=Orbilia oligospora TaxID=2813651 RepID=G1XIJ7_ARTOA|nr:hypothetical protein AOL_s00097g174 [Orbilia oligospora ATCC 24927]EGX47128.1 hypothetical protein AOL_s00097g174 [Orbilia oligospora ATCC 24927]KAF3273480.1 hypothetical protein TWF970_009003 [Orbilia oligospora]
MAAQNPTDATRTPFYTLPNEILVQIFSNKSLSNKDLTNAQLTCRLFKDNIQSFITSNRHYIFRVDEVSQPTWKLIRYLINNPELNSGHQIVSITVEWHRRVAKSEDTWTKPWFWIAADESKLESLFYKYRLTDNTRSNILHHGRNSESLLPLLLYFTPNLKILDLGNIDGRIVDGTRAECTSSFDVLRSYWDRSPDRAYRDEPGTLESDGTLFFFDNLECSDSLPALRGLKYFSMKCRDETSNRHSEMTLPPILGLPSIESIQASFTTSGSRNISGYGPNYDFGAKSTSSVKFLELSVSGTGGHSQEYFFSLAKLTGNLSHVNISRKYKAGEITRTLEGDEEIARTFLQYNRTTLQSSKIFINGGGFNDDGKYAGDAKRRKMVFEKQRLFELTRCRGPSSHPPSPFIALKPLLLSHIIPHLSRADIYNLMLSCKVLKDICQRNLWSIFLFPKAEDIKTRPLKERCLNVNNWAELEKTIEKYGIKDIENLETLGVGDEVFVPSDGGIYDTRVNKKRVFTIFSDQLRNGSTPNLKLVSIQLGCYGGQCSPFHPLFDTSSFPSMFGGFGFSSRPPSTMPSENASENACKDFLTLIKNYSEPLPPSKFSLHLTINIQSHYNSEALLAYCDLTKLTKLQLIGKGCRNLTDATLQLDRLVEILSIVSSVPNQQLKGLEIDAFGYKDNEDAEPSEYWEGLQEKLEVLQGLVFRLTKLRRLKVEGSIFDPSFILLPPPNVKSLSYSGRNTPPIWWETFSKYPFTGLEYLTLIFKYWTSNVKLPALKNIQLSSLREITINDDAYDKYSGSHPPGFINLIVNTNPGLSPRCLQAIADKKADRCNYYMSWRIPKIIELCGGELEGMLKAAVAGYAKKLIDEVTVEKKGVLNERFDEEVEDEVAGLVAEEFEKVMVGIFAEKCKEIIRGGLQWSD